MIKQKNKYALWSAEMLEKKWHQLRAKREKLNAEIEEVKKAYTSKQ